MTNSDRSDQDRPNGTRRQRILIGSQRDPAAYRARRSRDWVPVPEPDAEKAPESGGHAPVSGGPPTPEAAPTEQPLDMAESAPQPTQPPQQGLPAQGERPCEQEDGPRPEKPPEGDVLADEPAPGEPALEESGGGEPIPEEPPPGEPALEEATLEAARLDDVISELDLAEPGTPGRFPPPNLRERLSPDLEEEYRKALGDAPVDDLLAGDEALSRQAVLEPESRHTGRVVAVRREEVFVELGGREQGCVPVKQFDQPPQPGATLDVIVQRLNAEDGLYELRLPEAAVEADDWADLREGMLVEARVTGHNSGGLECEVNRLRGFIPVSQVSLYRVEDLGQFVEQKFTCLVTEADPERRNLVLSRRAVLEREKEEARQKLLDSLQPGQFREGVVRKLVDFGAFVDLGGIDGLLHISQVAWGRVQHPSEVLSEGQTIKVKIEKVDRAAAKISLAYREMLENPWTSAARKYPVNSVIRGTVTKLMDFGAFVELERGVEGLVHISELSHKRVWRVSDVVHEGDEVEVLVLSVDPEAQRMGLSIKAVAPEPEPAKKEEEPDEEPPPAKPPKRKKPDEPLQGGLGTSAGGEQFGLKW